MLSFFNTRSLTWFLPISILFFVLACGSPKKEEGNAIEGDSAVVTTQDTTANGAAKKMLRSIPSPLQVASMFKKAGMRYRADVLNPPSNVAGYSTNYSKAVNLGVYVADLAYSELNDQTQTAVTYFKACRTLADELEVSDVFESSGMQTRFQNNINNKDSILLLVADMNRDLINFFRENGRGNIATLAMVGGWVEGLYIAVRLAEKEPNEQLLMRIAEQKLLLNNLVLLLSAYQNESEAGSLLKEIRGIQDIYKGVEITRKGQGATTEASGHKTVLHATSKATVTPEQLKAITERIITLRNSLTGKSS